MTTKKMSEFMNEEITNTAVRENSFDHQQPTLKKKNSFSTKQKTILAILGIIILVLAGFYYKFNLSKKASEKRVQAETVRLVKEVKKIMVLPESDVPAIFDIQDPVLLTNQQAFFAGAQKGDKLLVYPQLGKAIIYSPERKMIVNVGPVTFDQTKSTPGNTSLSPQETNGIQTQ